MSSAAPVSTAVHSGRVEWLDLLRGVAVLAMIETHVANTFLAAPERATAWFGWLNYVNGLVAPSFLFIAGFAQGLTWRGRTEKPFVFARRAKRLLVIAIVGYALHFPTGDLLAGRWTEAVRIGSQVDVLQCLAASLLVVAVLQWTAQGVSERWRKRVRLALAGGALAGVVLATPHVQGFSGGLVPLAAFINTRTGSLFPLFPWTGFVLLGLSSGAIFGTAEACLLGAVILGAACFHQRPVPFTALHPEFFVERSAWVLAFAAGSQWVLRRGRPRLLLFAGRESLIIYVGHLIMIEMLAGAGVPRAGLTFGSAIAVFAGLVFASLGVAWLREFLSMKAAPLLRKNSRG